MRRISDFFPIHFKNDVLFFNAAFFSGAVFQYLCNDGSIPYFQIQRFNHIFCKKQPLLTLPDYQVDDNVAVLQGLDGRKMSKSYGNTIPLFLTEKQLQKHINKIKTNLLEPGEPKDPDDSVVFQIWKAFATQEQTAEMRRAFEEGIGWGDAKKKLFALINEEIAEARERYEDLLARPADIEAELQKGAEKARAVSKPMLAQVREAIGISGLK